MPFDLPEKAPDAAASIRPGAPGRLNGVGLGRDQSACSSVRPGAGTRGDSMACSPTCVRIHSMTETSRRPARALTRREAAGRERRVLADSRGSPWRPIAAVEKLGSCRDGQLTGAAANSQYRPSAVADDGRLSGIFYAPRSCASQPREARLDDASQPTLAGGTPGTKRVLPTVGFESPCRVTGAAPTSTGSRRWHVRIRTRTACACRPDRTSPAAVRQSWRECRRD